MEPPPEMIADAVRAIFLRVPPSDPARLLRAALVCKPWRQIECTDMPDVHGAEVGPVTMEDGSLGIAAVVGARLCLWSRNVDANGVARWVRRRVISIEKMLSNRYSLITDVIGFAEGVGVVFVRTADRDTFTVELKSRKIRKIRERVKCDSVIPIMSFYIPDRTSSRLTLAETVADLAQKMSAGLQISQP